MVALWQGIAAMALCLMVSSQASCQDPPSGGTRDRQETEPPPPLVSPTLVSPTPFMSQYPLELLGLLGPQRGGVTLTPSIVISEEFNDNITRDNQNRQWDFITNFGPALTLVINRRSLQLIGGYSTSADVYARESRFSSAPARQNFVFTGVYQATPQLTFGASESFSWDRGGVVAGYATGREQSWSNTFSPGMTWQVTPSNFLALSAGYSVLRFEGGGGGSDSDLYSFQSRLGHAFTPRLTGSINYEFGYLSPLQLDKSTSHTGTLGLGYRLTPTLIADVGGGAVVTQLRGERLVSPAGSARLTQVLRFGSASLEYTRTVSVAGGFGGPTDNQTYSGVLRVTTLLRGLIFVFNPVYDIAESVSSRQAEQVDVQTFRLILGMSYRLNQYTTVFAGYAFLRQRTGQSSSTQVEVDQNLVRVGLQVGYPFYFD
jgi:hypothetical protein